jgi:hypothetical protein
MNWQNNRIKTRNDLNPKGDKSFFWFTWGRRHTQRVCRRYGESVSTVSTSCSQSNSFFDVEVRVHDGTPINRMDSNNTFQEMGLYISILFNF